MRKISAKKQDYIRGFIAAIVAVLMIIPLQIFGTSHNEVGFYVSAVIPSNQIQSGLSYFDLRMEPEQIQELEVRIVNESDEEMTVTVEAITASTNRNGIIDYKTPVIHDKTLKYGFSSIAEVREPNITIPPNSTETAIITVTMPNEYYDGVILGGLVFTRVNNSTVESNSGVSVNNIFSYVIGVKLTETDEVLSPNFEITEIVPKLINYQPVFLHGIRNTEAIIIKDMNIDVSVKDSDGNIYAEVSKINADMAPNSVMPLGIEPVNEKIEPGNYTSEIRIEYNGETYEYSNEFHISGAVAKETNSGIISNRAIPENDNTYTFMLAFIFSLICVIVMLLFLIIYKRKAEKNIETEGESYE
jgi:Bacterial protein of unknown function (DUF916)./Protein of unknown function C-terminal (DUF3324).